MLIKKEQSELQNQIQTLSNELSVCKNIEKQHQLMNGKLYDEVDKLKKENEYLKKENVIIREGNERLGIYRKDNKLSEHQKTKPKDDWFANRIFNAFGVNRYFHSNSLNLNAHRDTETAMLQPPWPLIPSYFLKFSSQELFL